MRLISTSAWVGKYFAPESRPAEITLLRWLREAKIPGKKVGGKWYVDEDAWLAGGDPGLSEVDALVQRVLDQS